ncbi:G-protein coupled receptor dmsr-1-like [Dendroctonus ponderosae]|uniref:G-protein coupled receptors family 1 profile domain-containing protein n=1 Tax=Dendroctonus ponderosae TaxID=77166 RepID=A0AAR5P9H6_DENPD|nr:G-protein coupled receptor dmsr-1-like [Dendroctonus ponderosae]KAH1004172.1 hypothetical protein HUJ04_003968 [Dendroctonus ponderosae]KAH1010726.1 hypothetical protein HUJ05_004978 [Dendroctonus ponderosae]
MKNATYCDFGDFGRQYREYLHGYLSLSVCIFGSIANILNICVLRSKNMRSPTNYILTALALADLLVMLQYIPFTVHRNLPPIPLHYWHFSYGWALFYKFHSLFTLVLHFIACTLTIILAVWRYVFITQIHTNKICSNQSRTLMVILVTYFLCPLVCFPILSTLEIVPYQQTCDLSGAIVDRAHRLKYDLSELTNETIYILYPNDPYNLSIWVYTVLVKFVPCLLLTLLSYKIISALLEARRRKMKLMNANKLLDNLEKNKAKAVQNYKDNQADRTTNMLLAVLILFLITEFPQAILGLISAILGEAFLEECYAPLGDVMDIMALINSSINFILYCTMSRQFRSTFQEMFHLKKFLGWIRSPSSRSTLAEDTRAETKVSLV